jgi:hypothetical protein
VLIDLAQPARDPYSPGGHALAITLARPWASLVVLPNTLCPTAIHRSFDTDYRGALCIIAGHRIDPAGLTAAAAASLTADWRTTQTGWLGAAVLVDVHRAANCCQPWGHQTRRRDTPLYHWVFRHGARLARPVFGHGFLGIRAVSWGGLLRRNAATAAPEQAIGAALAATRTAAIRRGYRQLVDPAAPQQPGSPPGGTPT